MFSYCSLNLDTGEEYAKVKEVDDVRCKESELEIILRDIHDAEQKHTQHMQV